MPHSRAEHEGFAISFVSNDDSNLLDITEMAIGQRLQRRRLRGSNYQAPMPKHVPRAQVAICGDPLSQLSGAWLRLLYTHRQGLYYVMRSIHEAALEEDAEFQK